MLRVGGGIKLDSMWKWDYQVTSHNAFSRRIALRARRLQRGHFQSAMAAARRQQDGMRGLQHYQSQPWETWYRPQRKI